MASGSILASWLALECLCGPFEELKLVVPAVMFHGRARAEMSTPQTILPTIPYLWHINSNFGRQVVKKTGENFIKDN